MITLFKILKIKKEEKKLKLELIKLRYELISLNAYPHGFGIVEQNVFPLKPQDKIYQEKMKELQLKFKEVKILILNKEIIMKSNTYKVLMYLKLHKNTVLLMVVLGIFMGLIKYLS